MRALIVDDATYMRLKLRQLLEENNIEVVGEAENGEIAIQMYFEIKPDFVTMDITMPVMDGITAVEKITAKDPDAIIIMVSAKGQKDLIVDAIKKGAKDYVVKPYHAERVIESLQRLKKKQGVR